MDKNNRCDEALQNFDICFNDVLVRNVFAVILNFITRRPSNLLLHGYEHLGTGSLLT